MMNVYFLTVIVRFVIGFCFSLPGLVVLVSLAGVVSSDGVFTELLVTTVSVVILLSCCLVNLKEKTQNKT